MIAKRTPRRRLDDLLIWAGAGIVFAVFVAVFAWKMFGQ